MAIFIRTRREGNSEEIFQAETDCFVIDACGVEVAVGKSYPVDRRARAQNAVPVIASPGGELRWQTLSCTPLDRISRFNYNLTP